MVHPSKNKGNNFERELVNSAREDGVSAHGPGDLMGSLLVNTPKSIA